MNDPHQLDDDDVRALLERIVDDVTLRPSDREGLRNRMLDEFDRHNVVRPVSTERLGGVRPGHGVDETAADETEAHEVIELHRGPARAAVRRASWLAAAAVVVAAIGGGLVVDRVVGDGGEGVDAGGPATASEQTRRIGDGPLPAPVAPGPAVTDVIAGGLEIDLPAGLEVLREGGGVLALGRAGDGLSPRAVVQIVDIGEDVPPLGDLVATAVQEGRVSTREVRTVARDGLVVAYEVFVTPEHAGAERCTAFEACGTVGPVEINDGALTTLVEISVGDTRLWWVESTVQRSDPLVASLRPALATLRPAGPA